MKKWASSFTVGSSGSFTTLLALLNTLCWDSTLFVDASDSLAVKIREIENRPEYTGCKWGIHAKNITNNQIIYENPGSNLFSVPASNNKIPNTYAAWMSLGSDYIFETNIGAISYTSGNEYNITICGSNDPSLTTLQLQQAASEIALLSNINEANTINVRLDNSRGGNDYLFPNSWEWGDLIYYYGAIPGSFILDGNVITVRVEPSNEIGENVNVTLIGTGGDDSNDDNACFKIVNEALTLSDGDGIKMEYQDINGNFSLLITGSLSQDNNDDFIEDFVVSCRDPLRNAVKVFEDALISNGLKNIMTLKDPLQQVVMNTDECNNNNNNDDVMVLTSMKSETLNILLNHTLLESDNTYAEAILRRQSNDGSISSGITNVKTTLGNWILYQNQDENENVTLNMAAYSTVDGSGLSRHDLITPSFLANILAYADIDYIHLLPLAGKTGTLSSRFIGTVAEGILYAKTGTMSNVNALSGRVNDISFSILSDSCPQSSTVVRNGIDEIAVLFAELTV